MVEGWVDRFRVQLDRYYDFERPQRRHRRRQPRVDGGHGGPGVPARRRQALQREPHARPRGRLGAPGRRRHLLHRVQLPAAAVVRLRPAVPAIRVHAADGRLRPVGQHRRGRGPHPAHGRRGGPRPHDAAHDQVGRHQVRQDRVRHGVARSRAHQPVRVLPVLAQRRRSRCGAVPAHVQLPLAGGDRRAAGHRSPSVRRPERPSVRSPAR